MAPDHEFEGFEELVALLSAGPSDVVDEVPPPGLWERIVADLDAEGSIENAGGEASGVGADNDGPGRSSILGAASKVTSIEQFRRSRWGPITAAVVGIAAALLLVALPLGLALRSSPAQPDAYTTLDPVGGFDGDGWAQLDGRKLTVGVQGLTPAEDAHYELWLLALEGSDLVDLVSLGLIGDGDTFDVPDGIDLDRFDVVDISIEPDDGDPSHSGNSILQGALA